jgi:hypothetical protein
MSGGRPGRWCRNWTRIGQTVYNDRFAREYGLWRPVVARVADKLLACGVFEHGFARIRCDACTHEYRLGFSCTCRYCCPSCPAQVPRDLDAVAGHDTARAVGDHAVYATDPNRISYPSNGARGQSSGITLAFCSGRSHGWRAERATDYARLHQASLCSNLDHRRIRLRLWDGHTLRAKPFEMKLASRLVRSTASRVAPVGTQPGTSGAYAEHPEAVCSTTIRSFMTSALPA